MAGNDGMPVSWRLDAGRGMTIWQIMFTGSGTLVAQKRDTRNRQAFFFTADSLTGKLLAEGFQPHLAEGLGPAGDGWFTGLESTSENLVYCHAYQQNSPEHIGIWAFEAATGRIAWQRQDVVFSANLGNGLLVYRPSVFAGFPERHFMIIDQETGQTQRELGEDNTETGELLGMAPAEEDRQQLLLPSFAGSEGLPPECDGIFLPQGAMSEHICTGTASAVAVHEQYGRDGGWRSTLFVISGGNVRTDIMQADAASPLLNNFLIRGHKLYYIKEKEELVAVGLS
jgi:hypothetical protein